MVVEIGEQLAVLPQPLVEPGTVLDVELDSFLADYRLHLAHVSIRSAASAKPATRGPTGADGFAALRPSTRAQGARLVHIWCTKQW